MRAGAVCELGLAVLQLNVVKGEVMTGADDLVLEPFVREPHMLDAQPRKLPHRTIRRPDPGRFEVEFLIWIDISRG